MSDFFSPPCRSVRARVYDASGALVATVAYRRDDAEEARAVALIAAAPELLEALQAARCCVKDGSAVAQRIDAALAKAASAQSPA